MNKLKVFYKYFMHQLTANNRHGIHSPFVYNFLEQVVYRDKEKSKFDKLHLLRKSLLNDSRTIQITDLGAGSHINSSLTRKVSDIAKNSSKRTKYGRLFYRMIKYFEIEDVIELGTSLGLSTIYFSKANPKNVFTLEGCPETLKIAQENFKLLGLNNIKTLLGDFKLNLVPVLSKANHPNIIFFDGNHQEEPTLKYFEEALKYKSAKSIFIFDDIHWSEGMTSAWNKIKGHPETVVTLDLFFLGIVFFDSRLSSQHFKIKF
ncbi:MAG: O-methyltransferase [Salibacteraceae bacterium]